MKPADRMDRYVAARQGLEQVDSVSVTTLSTDANGLAGPLYATLEPSEWSTQCLFDPMREYGLTISYAEFVNDRLRVQFRLREVLA